MIIESLMVAAAQQQQGMGSMLSFMVPLLVVIVVMTFISSRTQKKQREKQQKMLDSMVKGTKIRTIGGFTGTIVEVNEETVMIKLAEDMPAVELLKNAVAMVIEDEKASDKDAEKK